MVVAELEAFYSRSVAPTRRIAVGELRLPGDSPGAGFAAEAAAILLGGMVAGSAGHLSSDDRLSLSALITDLELGRRIPQPRLRHRYQADRIGLQRSAARLIQDRGGFFHLDLDHERGTPTQQCLAALYALERLSGANKFAVIVAVRRALDWRGDLGHALMAHLRLGSDLTDFGPAAAAASPSGWARSILGLEEEPEALSVDEIRKAFRSQLLLAHPDLGGSTQAAAGRIKELDSARRILISSVAGE